MKNKIELRKVTWHSKLLAIIIYVATLFLGFFLGIRYENAKTTVILYEKENSAIKAVFACPGDKAIYAEFVADKVNLLLSDGRSLSIPRAISASGARYANADESFVFWNKGNGAFIEEKGSVTYDGCVTAE